MIWRALLVRAVTDDADKKELDKLQGTWKAVSIARPD